MLTSYFGCGKMLIGVGGRVFPSKKWYAIMEELDDRMHLVVYERDGKVDSALFGAFPEDRKMIEEALKSVYGLATVTVFKVRLVSNRAARTITYHAFVAIGEATEASIKELRRSIIGMVGSENTDTSPLWIPL